MKYARAIDVLDVWMGCTCLALDLARGLLKTFSGRTMVVYSCWLEGTVPRRLVTEILNTRCQGTPATSWFWTEWRALGCSFGSILTVLLNTQNRTKEAKRVIEDEGSWDKSVWRVCRRWIFASQWRLETTKFAAVSHIYHTRSIWAEGRCGVCLWSVSKTEG